MKKIILLGVIAVILLFTASTAMADTIVWQIGIFDYLYGVTDGTKITISPDKSTAPTPTAAVDYTDVSTFYSVLLKGTTITGTFTADLSKGAVLLISWSPGASGSEKFSVTLGETTKSSRTVDGSTCTSDPSDGRCGQVPSYYSGYPGLPYYTEIFDFGLVGSGTETHTLSINYSQGNGIGFDYLELSTPSPECVDPPLDMVSWWPGDEASGTTTADIVDANTGTLIGGAAFTPGMVGNALSFDGIDDYVNVGNDVSLTGADAGTIDAWIFIPSDTPASTTLAILGYGGDAKDEAFIVSVRTNEDSSAFHVGLFTERPLSGSPQDKNQFHTDNYFSTGFFHHIAWLSDSSAYKLFVDGAEESFSILQGFDDGEWLGDILAAPNDIVTIGTRKYEGALRFFFYGIIDEVEIFNRALSFAEIRAIYLAGSAGKCKVAPVIEVDIDIKPGSDPNSINLGERGLLPVAILGSADFDVETIDPDTIALGGVELATRGSKKAPKLAYSLEDVNDDGLIDMMTFFDVQELVSIDDVLTEDTTELFLTATLYVVYGGTPIEGSDLVRVIY